MSKADFERRTRALESRAQVGLAGDEETKTRAFLEKLTDEELERGLQIAVRTQDGTLPRTVEEQSFLDDLEARYGPI